MFIHKVHWFIEKTHGKFSPCVFSSLSRVVCEKDGRKRALVGKGMRKRGGEKSKKTVSEKNREIGKEGLGEEHRETRNSIWKKKKGVVVLEKQKKIKNGKNKSRGRRKGTKKTEGEGGKGEKHSEKAYEKEKKGKTSESNVSAEGGKAERNLTEERQEKSKREAGEQIRGAFNRASKRSVGSFPPLL